MASHSFRLEPPYRQLTPTSADPPAVGLVLIADLVTPSDPAPTVRALVEQARLAPDAPVCVIVPDQRPTDRLLDALEPLAGPVAFLFGRPGEPLPAIELLLDAARAIDVRRDLTTPAEARRPLEVG